MPYSGDDKGRISEKYSKAGNAYKIAAGKTKCEARRQFFLQMAEYLDCYEKQLQNGVTIDCKKPKSNQVPDCPADAGEDFISSGSGAATASDFWTDNGKNSPVQLNVQTEAAWSLKEDAEQKFDSKGFSKPATIMLGAVEGTKAFSDIESKVVFLAIGGFEALITHLSQKKAEKKRIEEQAKRQKEYDLEQLQAVDRIINQRISIFNSLPSGKMPLSSSSAKAAYIFFVSVVGDVKVDEFNILISEIIEIKPYPDGTWPFAQDLLQRFNSSGPIGESQIKKAVSKIIGSFSSPEEAYESAKKTIENLSTNGAKITVHAYTFKKVEAIS
ncbi:MAG: hypothetical protein EOP53_28045, partial [Sphingobacteriales bacterium]